MSVVRAGILFSAITLVAIFFGFTKANPFSNHFELKAAFENAQNLKNKTSEVRIAGVEVGRVTSVEEISPNSPGALITMEVEKSGLPVHQDAELKVRPQLFLEGNYFIDLKPGSPSAPEVPDGHTVPVTQTAIPVQLGDVLQTLTTDTRKDLRTALREYAFTGLNGGGAEGFNGSIEFWEPAYRSASLVNDATLGTAPGDLRKVVGGQQKTLAALVDNEDALQGLITNLNRTAEAIAREDDALQAAIPALRDVLTAGPPALRSLNSSLPGVRRFARDALPGVRSSGPTIDALIPFVEQLRGLVQPSELRGLVDDLRPTIPALARLNRQTVPILGESRAMGACTNNVLLPFAESPIPNPDAQDQPNNNQLVMRQVPRSLVGLAGESRITDAASPQFRVNFSGGNQGVFFNGSSAASRTFAALPGRVFGARPALPPKENEYWDFRPDMPCETQDPPNLEAPLGGPPEQRDVTALQPDLTLEELAELRERLVGAAENPVERCKVEKLDAAAERVKQGKSTQKAELQGSGPGVAADPANPAGAKVQKGEKSLSEEFEECEKEPKSQTTAPAPKPTTKAAPKAAGTPTPSGKPKPTAGPTTPEKPKDGAG